MGQLLRRAIKLWYKFFNSQIVSMECMITTNSMIGLLLLARIKLLKVLFACKIFLENYGYVIQSAAHNYLYQHARQLHLGR